MWRESLTARHCGWSHLWFVMWHRSHFASLIYSGLGSGHTCSWLWCRSHYADRCDVAHTMRNSVVRDTLVLQCDVGHTFMHKWRVPQHADDCDLYHILRCVWCETLSRISVMWLTSTPVVWCSAHYMKNVSCCALVSGCVGMHACEKMWRGSHWIVGRGVYHLCTDSVT